MQHIYLDNNSTTPIDPQVLSAMMADLSGPPANPSSIHFFGQRAKKLLQGARQTAAVYFGGKPDELIFTSGGTESINLLLRSLPKGHLITTDLEHACVYRTAKMLETQGYPVTFLSPGVYGAPTPAAVEAAIRPDTRAIILSASNGETGSKTDLTALAALAEKNHIPLLLDAVSYVGKEPLPLLPGISAVALSGHKFHSPKGIGALFVRSSFKITPLSTGGNQEAMRRAGTENLAGILGLAEALQILHENQPAFTAHMLQLRTHFETELFRALPDLQINGSGPRISNTSNIAFHGCDGETLLLQLDLAGIAASHGSACSAGALEPSRVLLNMGIDRRAARSSIRFSLNRMQTRQEIDLALERIVPLIRKLRSL
ncbi:MAG: cysteine desulfurase [Verrucomicrobiota bacterium]|nr:cysteine desulfurase [Verrucomicrobiota bacterium]